MVKSGHFSGIGVRGEDDLEIYDGHSCILPARVRERIRCFEEGVGVWRSGGVVCGGVRGWWELWVVVGVAVGGTVIILEM